MLDYSAARAVAAIIRTGSFEAAARELAVTPSAISQRVRNLEERLGTVLIRRGQPCTATQAGDWLCRHIEHVGMLENALMQHLPGLAGEGVQPVTLNIAANADSLGAWFLPALTRFAGETGYLFDIAIDDEAHTADWLRQGRVLAAVTALAQPVPGCVVTPLGRLPYLATASPDFMRRHFPAGVTPEALAQAPALVFNQKDRLQARWARRVTGLDPVLRCHALPSTQGFVDACLGGLGWGLNPAMLVRDHLAAGRLVELCPGAGVEVALFWQVSRLAAVPLRGLTRAVQAAAQVLRAEGQGAAGS
ncbi:LysR family transcriptional regulator ArgP [Paracoccus sp. (in: a-proteobacteria)]|uniref:LysR family transcriptional regulator ArgP n=1 Tax=Paracoccus sp. TaxID=267 RepID=UPI00272BED3E|nr:LysR family transcriptional regulator ArgP [Paracoccus sp. (in: a-proteobacteria)]